MLRRGSILLLIVIIASLISGCSLRESKVSNSITNPYDQNTIKVGDFIKGMKVEKIAFIDSSQEEYGGLEFSILFSGEIELTGKIDISVLTNKYYFSNNDYISEILPFSMLESNIENNKNEKINIGFDIVNEEELIKAIIDKKKAFKYGDEIKIKAIFTDYWFDLYEFEYIHSARFDRLVEIIE